jgi:hypothetical protein
MNARFKIIALTLIISVAAGNIILTPKKTEALFGIGDITFDPSNFVIALKDFALKLAEDSYKSFRDQASKRIIDSIVNDTARWIENGGQPRFITDWKKFLKDAGNVAIGDVLRETDLAFICSPFKVQLQFALRSTYTYQDQITCTLDQVVGNVEAFYDDFSQGGWIAYNQMWNSNNNFYGVYLNGVNQIAQRSAEAKETAKNEVVDGYKPEKACVLYDEADEDLDGNTSECLKYEVVNPGKTVGDIAANAIGADTEWATSIESWTSVLTNALVNRLTKEGVGWLKSQTSDIFSGNDSDLSSAAGYSPETQALADQKMANENKNMISELEKFIDFDWEYILHLKNESLAYTELRFQIATSVEAISNAGAIESCVLPFGYQYRPKSIESQIGRLAEEVQNLQQNIDINVAKARQLITEINLAVNPAERVSVQQKYSSFISDNDLGSVEGYIISAEQEWQDVKGAFDEIKKHYKDKCHIDFVITPEYKERLNIK